MEFVYKEINIGFIDAIFTLQQDVFKEGYDENLLRYNSKQMLKKAMSKGYTIGVFYKENLIAFGILLAYQNLIAEKEMMSLLKDFKYIKNYTIKLIIVKKNFRGKGLQRKIIKIFEDKIEEKSLILATVSPLNSYSLRNFLKCGYKILTEKKMYGGYNRLILYKERIKDGI